MKKKLLIIEDEQSVAKQLKWGLQEEYDITIAGDAEEARPLLASGVFPVATLDLGLPPTSDSPQQGFELLQELPTLSPVTRVIVITGNTEQQYAVEAIALGADDFCTKPFDLSILRIVLARTFKIHDLAQANIHYRRQASRKEGMVCGMLGISPAMEQVFTSLTRASKTDYPVLISGNTGTGKEMAARAVHTLSARSEQPLIIVNCGAIPENLIESELFGHEKGAFTGASSKKKGKFELADKGTIFLDEIGELPLNLQVKLLRVLQESTVERIGGSKTINLDVRIIAATNIDLDNGVQQGTFRQDLFYRLNVVPIEVPDLKDRQEDILLLAHNFLMEEARQLKRGNMQFSSATITALTEHNWPGNVRELQNRIRRALGTTDNRVITPDDLGLTEIRISQEVEKLSTLKEARLEAEAKAIRHALNLSGNNISKSAKLLEISRPTLHDLLKKHNIHL